MKTSLAQRLGAAALAVGLAVGSAGCTTDTSTEVEELDVSESEQAEQPDETQLDEEGEFESEEAELDEAEEDG